MKKIILILALFAYSCTQKKGASAYFEMIPAESSGLLFANKIFEDNRLNYFTYPYMYFGGGVAAGDINNDGLTDLIFTGSMVGVRVYLNLGDFKFKDVTNESGISGNGRWLAGVTMVDVNNDSFLDVFVCTSGKDVTGENSAFSRKNLLFINNGDLTFSERAEEFGFLDESMSVQATFFDMDNDGDLDAYIASYPEAKLNSTNEFWYQKIAEPTIEESDRLYRNDGNKFTEITLSGGILNYGLTLSVSAADINKDGWIDLYVSNDFNTPDYLYINNGDGTFTNEVGKYFRQISNYGMGADVADFNNDTWLDIFQLDMMPDNNYDKKANMGAMNAPEFIKGIEYGFHHQYMHNTLQLNNGNGSFSQISKTANVAETDWSWGALFFDMNNDGYNDLYVTNGIRRSVNNLDFNYNLFMSSLNRGVDNNNLMEYVKMIPEEPKVNYAYLNNGDLTFSDISSGFGEALKGYSNGLVYADLNNDGSLDLIVNNLDGTPSLYKNNNTEGNNYLEVKLRGQSDNRFGLGAKVTVYTGRMVQYKEVSMSRGFLSSVSPNLHFGVGRSDKIDSVIVKWSTGGISKAFDFETNKTLMVDQADSKMTNARMPEKSTLYSLNELVGLHLRHLENDYDDYKDQPLLPHKLSRLGPAIAVGDINNDGMEDIFIGNGVGFSGNVYIQTKKGFILTVQPQLSADLHYEDVDAIFSDFDEDGDLDLFVVSGGYEYEAGSENYRDRLYLNDGMGTFKLSASFSSPGFSGSCISLIDFDSDGDDDIFVGGFVKPHNYPKSDPSIIYENKGKGNFDDVTTELAPDFATLGIVQSAISTDYNLDGNPELFIVGDWMSPVMYTFVAGKFKRVNNKELAPLKGWWNSIVAFDYDEDGDDDYFLGNVGTNYKFAKQGNPIYCFGGHFDTDNDLDVIMAYQENNKVYPMRGRKDLIDQLTWVRDKFPNHESYANAEVKDILTKEQYESCEKVEASWFESILLNNAKDGFIIKRLDNLAQSSSINAIFVHGSKVVLGGNKYFTDAEIPRLDASYGLLLEKNSNDEFNSVRPDRSGFNFTGEVRKIRTITIQGKQHLLVAANNNPLQFYSKN